MPGTRVSGDVGGNGAVNQISPMMLREHFMPHSDYPVSRFLQRVIQESGLRRQQFVRAIGFKNTSKGLRRLDDWLADGRGDEHLLRRIVDLYHPDPAELQSALQETEAIHQREYQEAVHAMEERERQRFRPFIWVVSKDSAHSWVMAMAERQIKLLRFSEGFEQLSGAEQLATVQERVRHHYRETGGRLADFGTIFGYRYCDSFDTSMVLDPDGKVIKQDGGRFTKPEAWISLR
jgi:hypothetical protein